MSRAVISLLTLTALAVAPWATAGHPSSCHRCGNCCEVKKVCRAVCEYKEVKETRYDVVCEDYCLPGPSCCETCQSPCGGCNHQVWHTSCGKVRTRKKLVKIEETKKVPVTKCVVEYLCTRCCGH